ncbi:hypothetical protein GQR58_029769 [Nymphon striatum]|nr:hypothetical protein GQR58_029769 [Nymphon striatum]
MNEYVVLFKDDGYIISITLQYIYLEQGDSIQIRLNTIDFDESLVFSGSGADINNFLLDIFLANEEEESLIRSTYFELKPEEFHQQIETLRKDKLKALAQLSIETPLSIKAKNLAEVSINYTYYNYKEIYPFEHRNRTGKRIGNKVPSNFYAYRKSINFNNKNLNYLTPYYNFVKSHLKNISYNGCEVVDETITNQLHFNRHKLSLIDSLVQEDELKDNLFRNVAFEYLLRGRDTEKNNETFIQDFYLRSGNNRHISEINELYEGITNMQPKKKIPNVMVTNVSGKKVSLQDIAKGKKVAFYFWSGSNQRYFKDVIERAAFLSATKENYTFVGINYRTDESTWKGMIARAKLDKADDFEELAKALTIYQRNKCIITKDAEIVDGFTTLWAANL